MSTPSTPDPLGQRAATRALLDLFAGQHAQPTSSSRSSLRKQPRLCMSSMPSLHTGIPCWPVCVSARPAHAHGESDGAAHAGGGSSCRTQPAAAAAAACRAGAGNSGRHSIFRATTDISHLFVCLFVVPPRATRFPRVRPKLHTSLGLRHTSYTAGTWYNNSSSVLDISRRSCPCPMCVLHMDTIGGILARPPAARRAFRSSDRTTASIMLSTRTSAAPSSAVPSFRHSIQHPVSCRHRHAPSSSSSSSSPHSPRRPRQTSSWRRCPYRRPADAGR